MRRTLRLLANVKPARYLEPGAPTGLTGLYTHNSPRSTLLYLYSTTLDKLKAAPETSLYRQSVEALTKHRMSIVAAAEPPGHKEWAEKASKILAEHPEGFRIQSVNGAYGGTNRLVRRGDDYFMLRTEPEEKDQRYQEWDWEPDSGEGQEGLRSAEERVDWESMLQRVKVEPADPSQEVQWEPEPQLTAEQVEEIETKIGAGLIEEVVQMAESELKLVGIMLQHKPWEDLEEKPAEGQWEYFERKTS